MFALPWSGEGRWIIAQRPLIRRGNIPASLSSGGIIGPNRLTVRKSRVMAIETSGPRQGGPVASRVDDDPGRQLERAAALLPGRDADDPTALAQ